MRTCAAWNIEEDPIPTVAIVADDLTGALDAAAPFAAHGISTVVATDASKLGEALATGAAIIAVNTGSRTLGPEAAGRRVQEVATRLHQHRPQFVFKKVDSRLKGPIAAEINAALSGFERDCAILCPAIPEFGRVVIDGTLSGAGIDAPIAVRKLVDDPRVDVADAENTAMLDAIAARIVSNHAHLAVGARGLAEALARHLFGSNSDAPITLPQPIMIGIGSVDPITRAQIARLRALLPQHDAIAAPNGNVNAFGETGITLIFTTNASQTEPADIVSTRFAKGMARAVQRRAPASLILSGGETAEAILHALGIGLLSVEGEAEPGIAVARATDNAMKIVTKSGGFGGADTLLHLVGHDIAVSTRTTP